MPLKIFRLSLIAGLLLGALSAAAGRSASAQEDEPCPKPFTHVSLPLNDLGEQTYIRMDGQDTGEPGGLYPGGSNTRPAAHTQAGLEQAALVVPRDAEGQPDSQDGKIALISIGMSNTNQEFGEFMQQLEGDGQVNPQLVLVNAALPGAVSNVWADPDSTPWVMLPTTLANRGVTPAQVQAAWIKLTRTDTGGFPEWPESLEADILQVLHLLKERYPNVRLVFFSSRTYSYHMWSGLNPEPYAFESAFAVRWLIERQINGDPELNYRPEDGPVVAPWLSWGPYLWIDGTNPRSDGRVWLQEDLVIDCTHPSQSGEQKVAAMLDEFFKSDAAAVSWFLGDPIPEPSPSSTQPPPTPGPSPTPGPEVHKTYLPFIKYP